MCACVSYIVETYQQCKLIIPFLIFVLTLSSSVFLIPPYSSPSFLSYLGFLRCCIKPLIILVIILIELVVLGFSVYALVKGGVLSLDMIPSSAFNVSSVDASITDVFNTSKEWATAWQVREVFIGLRRGA